MTSNTMHRIAGGIVLFLVGVLVVTLAFAVRDMAHNRTVCASITCPDGGTSSPSRMRSGRVACVCDVLPPNAVGVVP